LVLDDPSDRQNALAQGRIFQETEVGVRAMNLAGDWKAVETAIRPANEVSPAPQIPALTDSLVNLVQDRPVGFGQRCADLGRRCCHFHLLIYCAAIPP
jgi:hypothetical protein